MAKKGGENNWELMMPRKKQQGVQKKTEKDKPPEAS